MTSTLYASWANATSTLTVREYVTNALGGYAAGHNVEAIVTEFAAEVSKVLPEWLNLYGDEFLGEAGHEGTFDLSALTEAIEEIDFDAIAQKHAI